jgi:hypothetical protein
MNKDKCDYHFIYSYTIPQLYVPVLDLRHFETHVALDASFLAISDTLLSALAAQRRRLEVITLLRILSRYGNLYNVLDQF